MTWYDVRTGEPTLARDTYYCFEEHEAVIIAPSPQGMRCVQCKELLLVASWPFQEGPVEAT
jgi:hypothetical protein